jgi:predicted NACHT family NTPase
MLIMLDGLDEVPLGMYEDICRLQLKERPKARQLESVLLNCNAQEILQPLALEMMQRQSRLLRRDEVLAILQNTLAARSEAIAAADFLAQVTDIGELLIQQEEDYQFSHLSFQEYLAAVELVKRQQEALLYDRMKVQGEFADAWPSNLRPQRFFRSGFDCGLYRSQNLR